MPRRGLCPSARAEEGALLLGVVTSTGRVQILPRPASVTRDFLAVAREGRPPEERFRFAAPCQQDACLNWRAGGCGLPERIAADRPSEHAAGLPACAIRPACVWFFQAGPAACSACPEVVTDLPASHRGLS